MQSHSRLSTRHARDPINTARPSHFDASQALVSPVNDLVAVLAALANRYSNSGWTGAICGNCSVESKNHLGMEADVTLDPRCGDIPHIEITKQLNQEGYVRIDEV